jgi:hypothetical protein
MPGQDRDDVFCLTSVGAVHFQAEPESGGPGPVTAGTLAEAKGLTSGAITGVIDRLERSGFARREPDPGDRRKVLVRALPCCLTSSAVRAQLRSLPWRSFAPLPRRSQCENSSTAEIGAP